MNIEPGKRYAVITGDLVNSSKLESSRRRKAHEVMRRGSDELRAFLPAAVPLEIDVFAGDRWQILLSQSGCALRAALFYRVLLLAEAEVDTRLAAAIGTVDFVPGNRVSEGDGAAFRLSGRLLEQSGRYRMRFVAEDSSQSEVWDAMFVLADALISRRWTARSARAVSGALRGWSQAQIADLWSPAISPPAVAQHLRAASWPAMEEAIRTFEKHWGDQ